MYLQQRAPLNLTSCREFVKLCVVTMANCEDFRGLYQFQDNIGLPTHRDQALCVVAMRSRSRS